MDSVSKCPRGHQHLSEQAPHAELGNGSYPKHLQQRIRGPGGHLSNIESAELLDSAMNGLLQWACLAHLSEENNTPQKALGTHRRVLGKGLPLCVASRYESTDVLEL